MSNRGGGYDDRFDNMAREAALMPRRTALKLLVGASASSVLAFAAFYRPGGEKGRAWAAPPTGTCGDSDICNPNTGDVCCFAGFACCPPAFSCCTLDGPCCPPGCDCCTDTEDSVCCLDGECNGNECNPGMECPQCGTACEDELCCISTCCDTAEACCPLTPSQPRCCATGTTCCGGLPGGGSCCPANTTCCVVSNNTGACCPNATSVCCQTSNGPRCCTAANCVTTGYPPLTTCLDGGDD